MVIKIRIKARIQDPKSRIKMRKLKRDGAPVILLLLSFALNKGSLRFKYVGMKYNEPGMRRGPQDV